MKYLRNVIWRIYFKQEHRNVCPICGNITPFDKNNFNKTGILYRKYCCSSCAAKSKERNDKYKHTCLLKYGVENPLNIEDVRQLSITNAQSEESVYKRNKTYIEKYNGIGLGSPIISNKIRTTIKDKKKKTIPKWYSLFYYLLVLPKSRSSVSCWLSFKLTSYLAFLSPEDCALSFPRYRASYVL